ncbi:MAG: hypothetical protein AAF604_14060 [Acidobacteriota bacterium]
MGLLLQVSASADEGRAVAGELVDGLVCASDAEQTYAVYLPTGYVADRPWPVMVVLDARGRGASTAERFRAGAERFGYIVASSNGSRSDDGWEPIEAAVDALLDDLPRRFAIDPRRYYVAGFSGTSRGATAVAYALPGQVAGVLGASGAFPRKLPPESDLSFVHFGTAGSEDFNYWEMERLDERLRALGKAHRFERFAGGHDWPPAAIVEAAFGWFEVQAMRSGLRPRDDALVEQLRRQALEQVAGLEAQGDRLAAFRRLRSLHEDLAGLVDAEGADQTALERRLIALAKHPEVREGLAEMQRVAAWEETRRREVESLFGNLGRPATAAERTQRERQIHRLQKAAADRRRQQRADAARRTLELIWVRTSFYYYRDFIARQNFGGAAASLSLALEVRPQDVRTLYNLACALARQGRRGPAFDALERAIAAGYRDAAHLARDPDLASLRGEERYRRLLGRLSAPDEAVSAKQKSPPP